MTREQKIDAAVRATMNRNRMREILKFAAVFPDQLADLFPFDFVDVRREFARL